MQPAQPDAPIIVRMVDEPSLTWGDVVLNALGLSGVIAVGALIVGLLAGGCFIAFRIRQQRRQPPNADTDHQQLHLNA